MDYGAFGRNLYLERMKRGLTQQEVAENTGLSDTMICLIEKGFKEPSLKSAKIISIYLGVSLDELTE